MIQKHLFRRVGTRWTGHRHGSWVFAVIILRSFARLVCRRLSRSCFCRPTVTGTPRRNHPKEKHDDRQRKESNDCRPHGIYSLLPKDIIPAKTSKNAASPSLDTTSVHVTSLIPPSVGCIPRFPMMVSRMGKTATRTAVSVQNSIAIV